MPTALLREQDLSRSIYRRLPDQPWRVDGWSLPVRFIPVMGRMLKVPRHIVRIESYPDQRIPTLGWQVRYQCSALFSDSHFHDEPRLSLRAAKSYLRTIYNPKPALKASLLSKVEMDHKLLKIGVPGVFFKLGQTQR